MKKCTSKFEVAPFLHDLAFGSCSDARDALSRNDILNQLHRSQGGRECQAIVVHTFTGPLQLPQMVG